MKMVNILILLMLEDRLPSVLSSCCVLVQGSVRQGSEGKKRPY